MLHCPGRNKTSVTHFFSQYLCLVSIMIHNICVLYPWYTIFISGIRDTQSPCLYHVSDFMYCRSHPIKFIPIKYWRNCNIGRLVAVASELWPHDPPMSYPVWLDRTPYQICSQSVKYGNPMRQQTDTHTNQIIYIGNYEKSKIQNNRWKHFLCWKLSWLSIVLLSWKDQFWWKKWSRMYCTVNA